jgi:hypothetical protein
MNRHRKFRQSLRRLIFAGVVAGAGFAPAVASAHVSPLGGPTASQRLLAATTSTGFVQVGGDLVQRSQVAMWRHEELGSQRASTVSARNTPPASSGFNWTATIIAVASVAAACLLVASAYVVRRRPRATPA